MSRVLAVVVVAFGFGLSGVGRGQSAADLATIEQRIESAALSSVPSSTTVAGYQSTLQADGSWADINYASTTQTNWEPHTHLDRLRLMCRAYAHPSGSLYQNAALLADLLKAYDWWIADDPQSTNWWYNQLSVPQTLGEIMVLVKDQLSAAQKTPGLAILQRAYIARTTNSGTNTGLNRVDRAIAGIHRGVVAGSLPITSDAFLAISDSIVVTTAEGIQRDGSFHQHGAQLYNQGYGSGYLAGTLKWVALAAGTGFAVSEAKCRILTDYLLDGTRWMARGQAIDYTVSGRGLSRKNSSANASGLGSLANTAITMSPSYRTAELQSLAASISAANGTGSADPSLAHTGAKHFWRGDLTTWHRPAGYAGVKISSTRTLQPESGNGEGLKNYHLADGVNLIFRTGNEYDDIMPVWNWRKLPGTTTEQGTYSLKPTADWGVAGNSTYAGGISDGTYAATAFRYSRRNVAAKKAWFFFDHGFTALGADIDAPAATAQVETTLNQSLLIGPVTYGNGSTPQTLATGTSTLAGLQWVHHDGTGYFFHETPSSASLQSAAQTGTWQSINTGYDATSVSKNVFALSIRHGTAISNASYAYSVVPGLSSAETSAYANPISILRNDATVQAARDTTADVTQAAFYAADSLAVESGQTLAANAPSLLMLRRETNGFHLSAATPESKALSLGVQLGGIQLPGWLSAFSNNTAVTFGLPGGDLAGSTVGLHLSTDGAENPVVTFAGTGGFTALAASFASPLALPGNTTFSSDDTNLSFAGEISGSGSLTKSGTATLQISGPNTYTGGTVVHGGTLNLANDQSNAPGGWSIGPASAATTTVNFQGGSTVVSNEAIRIGNHSASGTSTQTLNVAGSVTNHGSLHVGRPGVLNLNTGGNWTQHGPASLNGHGGYRASLTVNSGGTFTYDGDRSFGVNPAPGSSGPAVLTIAGGTFTTTRGFSNSTISSSAAASLIVNTGGTLKLAADIPDLISTAGTPFFFQLGTGGGKVHTDGFDAVMDDPISDASGESGALTKTGTGTLTLSAINTHSGGTTVASGGGTLFVTRPEALGSGPIGIPKAGTASGTLALAFNGTHTISNVFSGFNSTTFNGDATLPTIHHLSGDTTIPADLTITGMGGNGLYLRSDGGLLTLAGTLRQSVGTIRNLGLGGSGEGVISGPILTGTGGLGLVKDGTGTWTLTGSNTYNARTTINAGTLRIGEGGTPGSAEILVNAGGCLDFRRSGHLTVSNTLSGDGELVHSGSGRTLLSGSLSYTGKTSVTAGTLAISTASLADTAPVEISGAAVLALDHAATDTISSLTFDGVLQANGIWGAPGSGADHESPRLSGTGRLLVTLDPFIAWLDAHPHVTDRSEDGDPDADGWPALIEFALGLDPLAFDPPPAVRMENGQLVMEFIRNAISPGVTLVPEVSADLADWSSDGIFLDESAAPIIRVRLSALDSHRFLRLSATRP